MTVRQSVIAKLRVSLDDEQEVETLPLAEIQANLRALGSDPAASIAFAKRLAAARRLPVANPAATDARGAAEAQTLSRRPEPVAAVHARPATAARVAAAGRHASQVSDGSGNGLPVADRRTGSAELLNLVGARGRRTRARARRPVALAASVALLFIVGAAAYASLLPPIYEAEALVMLSERRALALPGTEQTMAGHLIAENGPGQLLEIQSRGMAERMVDQLDLDRLPEFNPALRRESSPFAEWLDPSGLIPSTILDRLPRAWADILTGPAYDIATTKDRQAARLSSAIVDNVMRSISAAAIGNSTVIGLRFASTDPQLAARGADTLARLYLAERLETEQSALRRAREFLDGEIGRLRTRVAAAEHSLSDASREAGLRDAASDQAKLSQLAEQLFLTRSERSAAEARLRRARDLTDADLDPDQVVQMLERPILNESGRDGVHARRADHSGPQPAEPAMVEEGRRAEIDQITQRLSDELLMLRSREEALMLRSREEALQASIDSVRSQISTRRRDAGGAAEAWRRDLDADRERLELYVARAEEIARQQQAQEPGGRILSRATTSLRPTLPQNVMVFGIVLLAILALSLPQTLYCRKTPPASSPTLD